MSWLSSLFGSGGEDPEAVRQRQAGQAAEQARLAQAASERQMQMQIDYLNQLRADQAAKEAEAAAKDPTATREAALQSINTRYAPGFESSYLPDTYDDPLAGTLYGEERGKAEDYLNNLLKRGVITQTGFEAGGKDLDTQGARVRTQLQDIGKTLLDQERSKLGGIIDTGRQRAGSLGVNEAFDFTPYDTQVQSSLGDFGSKFSDAFRANIPGDLFDTSKLASIAGGAQGAGNLGFDPNAVAGATGTSTTDETDPFTGQKPIQKRTSTVF
jgi:hypothetical protein